MQRHLKPKLKIELLPELPEDDFGLGIDIAELSKEDILRMIRTGDQNPSIRNYKLREEVIKDIFNQNRNVWLGKTQNSQIFFYDIPDNWHLVYGLCHEAEVQLLQNNYDLGSGHDVIICKTTSIPKVPMGYMTIHKNFEPEWEILFKV